MYPSGEFSTKHKYKKISRQHEVLNKWRMDRIDVVLLSGKCLGCTEKTITKEKNNET